MEIKDTVRLNKESQGILKKHALDVNVAIDEMDSKLTILIHELETRDAVTEALQKSNPVRDQEYEREIERLKGIADELQKKVLEQGKVMWQSSPGLHDERYWKTMSELLNKQTRELTGQDGGL
jgi:hypothetical protein